jgi:hypothetical protein
VAASGILLAHYGHNTSKESSTTPIASQAPSCLSTYDQDPYSRWEPLSPPPLAGMNWAAWSDMLGREMYLQRALAKLNLELPSEQE